MKERDFLHELEVDTCGTVPSNSLQARQVLRLAKAAGATFDPEPVDLKGLGLFADYLGTKSLKMYNNEGEFCRSLTNHEKVEVLRRCKAVEKALARLPPGDCFSGEKTALVHELRAILEGTHAAP